jgi:flagellar protein FlgJ
MEGIKDIVSGVGQPRADGAGGSVDKQAAEKEKKLKKACADFESVLVYQLFKSMRKTVPAGGLLDKSPGKDTYTMIMDQKVAEDMANRGDGLGIQKVLFNQLSGQLNGQLNRNTQKKGGSGF